MFPASRAACVPVFIATPTSACGERGRVVRAVAGHRDEVAARLLAPDQRHLVLGLRLGEEVVDARLLGDRLRGQRVVAGDHHRADPHRPQLREALAHALLDDVLEVDDAERPSVARRRRAACRRTRRSARRSPSSSAGTVPPAASIQRRIASAAPLRIERPSRSTPLIRVSAVNGTSVAARRRRARAGRSAPSRARRSSGPRASRRRGSRAARRRRARAPRRPGSGRNSVAWRLPSVIVPVLSSSSVEQSPAASTARPREREHVAAHEPVHAGDPDRREQAADRRRDQADEQRDEHDHVLLRARVDRERLQRHDREQEDDRQPGEQDVERDLVRRLLALGALDERDHPVEEALARLAP